MANKSITALEITATQIKLAQSLEKYHSRVIKKLLVNDIRLDSEDEIARAVNELLAQSKLKSETIVLAIPRQFLTLRIIRLPSQDIKEIDKMVSLQIPKQIPWALEDVAFDYLIIEKDSAGYSKILLVICQKEVIKRYLKALSQSSLKVLRVTLSSEGICKWYENFSSKHKIKDTGIVMLLDVDCKNTDICFYYRENLLFTRSIAFGIADLKEEKASGLIEELRKTISALQRDQITSEISKILIISQSSQSNILIEKLKAEFSCSAEVLNPWKDITLEKELSLPIVLSQGNCSATSILGLVSGRVKDEINLLPEEIKKDAQQKSKIKDLASLGILLLLLLGFFAIALLARIYKKESYLKELNSILTEEGPKAKSVETSLKKLSLLKERLNLRGSSIDVIYELYNLIPEGITLSIFSFDEGQFITLQGTSLNMSDVFNFQSTLEKSPYFQNVEVKYASKRKVRQAEVTDFRITLVVEKEKLQKP